MNNWINILDSQPEMGQGVICFGTWKGEVRCRQDDFICIGVWQGDHITINSGTYGLSIVDVKYWMVAPDAPELLR